MFRAASDDDIEAYSDTVTCFIRKCIEDVVPTKTIRIYPNQKPWINSDVLSALSARTSAFKSGNTDDRKQASYDLRRSIKSVMDLHSSYDQRDPCGEGEQLQVPRCKHLRGPDMDCTHPNTGEESQAKAVPSATAEEIQGLTSYPENFLFRGHRKCTDSVHLGASQCGIIMPQTRTAKLYRESCA